MRKAADHLGSASGAVVEDVSVAMHYEGRHEFFVKVLFKWRDSHRVVSQSIKLFIGQYACQACLAVLPVIQLVEDLPSVSFILVPLFFTFHFSFRSFSLLYPGASILQGICAEGVTRAIFGAGMLLFRF